MKEEAYGKKAKWFEVERQLDLWGLPRHNSIKNTFNHSRAKSTATRTYIDAEAEALVHRWAGVPAHPSLSLTYPSLTYLQKWAPLAMLGQGPPASSAGGEIQEALQRLTQTVSLLAVCTSTI